MIIVLIINLSWIIFDWIFAIDAITEFTKNKLPSFYDFYFPIHINFFYYDLIFVAIFSVEIITRWIIAIIKRKYYKWFFYPIVHWYDVLGTVPVGGFLLLRFLRLFSIIYRLNKLQIIDITKTYFFKKANKYINIIIETISDRVVINVLNGLQEELKSGTPVTDRIIDEIILPNQNMLTNILTEKITKISSQVFENHQNDLEDYIAKKVKMVFKENKDVNKIQKIPVVGYTISRSLQESINEIIYKVIESIVEDISSKKNDDKIKQIADDIFSSLISDAQKDTEKLIQNVVVDSIEVIKDQVKVEQWKIKELEDLEKRLHNTKSEKSKLKIIKLLAKKRKDISK